MSTGFFGDISKIKYEGPTAAIRWPSGTTTRTTSSWAKRMEGPSAICRGYWHTFCLGRWRSFGGRTSTVLGFDGAMDMAKLKADVAFEFFQLLGVPFYCFNDADVRPEGKKLRREHEEPQRDRRLFRRKAAATGVKLLWGTANLFSNRRFCRALRQSGPGCVCYSAATIKTCMDATMKLGGRELCPVGRPRGL